MKAAFNSRVRTRVGGSTAGSPADIETAGTLLSFPRIEGT